MICTFSQKVHLLNCQDNLEANVLSQETLQWNTKERQLFELFEQTTVYSKKDNSSVWPLKKLDLFNKV